MLFVVGMKTMLSILVVAMVTTTGCATHTTSPAARANAVQLYATGASCTDIASQLQISRDEARELVRTGIVDMNRRLYRSH